jgi:hypothetical protein
MTWSSTLTIQGTSTVVRASACSRAIGKTYKGFGRVVKPA